MKQLFRPSLNYAGVVGFKAGRLEEIAMHPTVKPVAMGDQTDKGQNKGANDQH